MNAWFLLAYPMLLVAFLMLAARLQPRDPVVQPSESEPEQRRRSRAARRRARSRRVA